MAEAKITCFLIIRSHQRYLRVFVSTPQNFSRSQGGIPPTNLTPIAVRFENRTDDPEFNRGCAKQSAVQTDIWRASCLLTLKIFTQLFLEGKTIWLN